MKHAETLAPGTLVSLVGAGPGDPDLLTLKAARLLGQADYLVYDRLVSDEVLALARPGIPKFFAGKSCKEKAMTQEEINTLLIELARKGGHVVRLKGGDPLLFGRGGEEALALAQADIPFQIVPGVTAAQACAAYAGIPLTHRGLATGVHYITGHRMAGEDALALDWKRLADPDTTLVIYMGLANLPQICRELMAHGMPEDTPAAIVFNGTASNQQIVAGTVSNIQETIKKQPLESPSLIIIGQVAKLAGELNWFHSEAVENTSF